MNMSQVRERARARERERERCHREREDKSEFLSLLGSAHSKTAKVASVNGSVTFSHNGMYPSDVSNELEPLKFSSII